MAEQNQASGTKVIRPAASLLIVRDGDQGIEVLAIKRSMEMKFLPGYLAFPGGSLDSSDWKENPSWWTGSVVAHQRHDDMAYAIGAIRECAEEIGWLCAVSGSGSVEALSEREQTSLLNGEFTLSDVIGARGAQLNGTALRFVGRWVTPPNMPARFDTRFFLFVVQGSHAAPRLLNAENDWARWYSPETLLDRIASGEDRAVPPTIAMLKGIAKHASTSDCFASLSVPGPSGDELVNFRI